MDKIEIAKMVIKNDGICTGLECKECPAYGVDKECLGLKAENKSKVNFMNLWLSKNDRMAEKIQFTEEQADYFISYTILPLFKIEEITSELKNRIKNIMVKNGYIRKSLLQQKVEEAEDYYRIFKQKDYNIEQEYNFMREALISCHEVIQLFKEKHPEDFI